MGEAEGLHVPSREDNLPSKVSQWSQKALLRARTSSFSQDLSRQGGRPYLDLMPDSAAQAATSRNIPWLQEVRSLIFHCPGIYEGQLIAWEKLHTGNWKDVHMSWRDAYTLSCVLMAEKLLTETDLSLEQRVQNSAAALRSLDLAAMMGGQRFRAHANALISLLAAQSLSTEDPGAEGKAPQPKRQKTKAAVDCQADGEDLPFRAFELPGRRIQVKQAPSLEAFWASYMQPERPVIISGAIDYWPAMQRWSRLEYFLEKFGNRTVPVEVGSHYLAQDWGQQLMLFSDYIRSHLMGMDTSGIEPRPADSTAEAEARSKVGGVSSSKSRAKAYLAQHPLFDQIPELQHDIDVPMYCCLGEGELQTINAWFGPAGTVTPLHYDPHHNLFAQVVGRKYIRIYPPSASAALVPYKEGQTTNSSQINLEAPTEEHKRVLESLPFEDCIINPGEMLYLPSKHWHFVKSLELSFSVTFWWQ